MMFISIYYAPLHLTLGRPHTITVLGTVTKTFLIMDLLSKIQCVISAFNVYS
ncbi:hypothetical protein KSP39_PZI022740 [Platanthera zijinensis]|uniref:Uncharacterized protein n=1 Tax=Platanthera zijinensis TaxID=2320716 RepID=A0AAP0FU91_9ASPA